MPLTFDVYAAEGRITSRLKAKMLAFTRVDRANVELGYMLNLSLAIKTTVIQ